VSDLGFALIDGDSVPCLELRTEMTLLSAHEDFVLRTLGSLQGCWARLVYTAQLREPNGTYSHWGFDRIYGEEKAQATIQQAHREVFRTILRQRVEELASEGAAATAGRTIKTDVDLVPQGVSRAAQLHFNAVFFALVQLHNAKHRVA
jgi:hypothetical protein